MASQTTSIRQVFISHDSEADGQFAHRLAGDLRRLGVPVWIAPDSIRPGETWLEAVERGIDESSHVLVVLTPAGVGSKWVRMETNTAITLERNGRIQVIPLSVTPCEVPPFWRQYQMIHFRRSYDAGFTELVGFLGLSTTPPGVVSSPHEAPRPQPKAQIAQPTAPERRQSFEPELVLIPAGEFLMGSDPNEDEDAGDDEQPQHRLYLPDYYVAKTPVTNARYVAFVEAAGLKPPSRWKGKKPPQGKKDHPVVFVSWYDAVAYCKWLAEATNKPYRLPSEAEWEKGACGMDGRIYPWGNEWDAKRCNTEEGGKGGTTPVGAYPQGAGLYGLLDMVGNVWEWCHSLYRPYPYDATDGREDAEAGDMRVLRGGAFSYDARCARCASRSGSNPDGRIFDVGFRLVLAPRAAPS